MDVQAPAYEETERVPTASSSTSVTPPTEEWLKGTYTTERTLMLIYNPSPTGEVTVLDLNFSGIAADLGVWNIKLDSNPVIWRLLACLSTKLTVSGRYAPYSNAI
jgi:hypothetical protein